MNEEKLQLLRKKALSALDQNDLEKISFDEQQKLSVDHVLEELRIYQAELEIQNESLRATQIDLEFTNKRYKTLFNYLPIAAILLDGRGVIQEVNHQTLKLLNYPKEIHLINHSIYRFFNQASSSWIASVVNGIANNLVEQELVLSSTDANQIVLANMVSMTHVFDEHRYLLLLSDLSMEIEKKEQKQLFEALINNSSSLIYAFDRDGSCLIANNKLIALLEKNSLKEVKGKKRDELMSKEDAKKHFENDSTVYAQQQAISYEEGFKKEGKEYYFLSHKFPLWNMQDEIYAVGGVSIDITKIRMYEKKLQMAMKVISKGNEGIMVCDAANKIEFVNDAFSEITGYDFADVLGKDPKILSSGKHDKDFYRKLWGSINKIGYWKGEIWNKTKNGKIFPEILSISAVQADGSDEFHYLAVFSDISKQIEAEEEVHNLAFFDSLTGCANRSMLKQIVEQKISEYSHSTKKFAMLFIDLDHFKEVNDVFGHEVGDSLLKSASKRIQNTVRQEDTVSRIGGDEFVVLLSNIDHSFSSAKVQDIISVLEKPFLVDGHTLRVTASIGVATYPDSGSDYSLLLKNADAAMYEAKNTGRNTYQVYDESMTEVIRDRLSIEVALRKAIEHDELKLALQPQVSTDSNKVVGFEALLRWEHPEWGSISPNEFIPIAERSDLIVELSNWVLHKSLYTLQELQKSCPHACRVCVNISAREFIAPNFADRILEMLKLYPGVAPGSLELELTERIVMNDIETVKRVFSELKQAGIRLALDDFGTGYSSLGVLKNLHVDVLKIDMSFVRGLETNEKDRGICKAVIGIAKALDIEAVSEGVESHYQHDFMKQQGATLVQGFLTGKPMFYPELFSWLESKR